MAPRQAEAAEPKASSEPSAEADGVSTAEPVDDVWEVVPSKAKKGKKHSQEAGPQGGAEPTKPRAAMAPSAAKPTQQQPPVRRGWDAKPPVEAGPLPSETGPSKAAGSTAAQPSAAAAAPPSAPGPAGAAPASAWAAKAAQPTTQPKLASAPARVGWGGQRPEGATAAGRPANAWGQGAPSACNGTADTDTASSSSDASVVADGAKAAAGPGAQRGPAASQPRPVQWPALDGADNIAAAARAVAPAVAAVYETSKLTSENAGIVAVAAVTAAASAAASALMNAAVAASGGMGGVGGQPGDAGAAKPSGGSSWASLVTKNIEKKPEAKALNAKGFTVLAGAATCVNGAASAASGASGGAVTEAPSGSDAEEESAGAGGAGAPADRNGAPRDAAACGCMSSQSTHPKHQPPVSFAAAAANRGGTADDPAAAGAAPRPAPRAWGAGDARPTSLVLPKSATTAATNAAPAANSSSSNSASYGSAGSYSQAAAPPSDGKQAGARAGAASNYPGCRPSVPYGMQAHPCGYNAQTCYADYGAEGSAADSTEEHEASHAFGVWAEAVQESSGRKAGTVRKTGVGGRGGRGGQVRPPLAPAMAPRHAGGVHGGGERRAAGRTQGSPAASGQMQMQPPMMTEFKLSKLHNEIVAFANSNLAACESSHAEVQAIKTCLLQVVTKRWASATVEMYGSRSTGLYLASSDMDVVLMGVPVPPREVGEALKQLHADLAELPWVARQTLVLGARIPVLKLASTIGVAVDMTISASPQHTGLMARDLVLSYLQALPQLAPLVVVLKSFLRDLNLNDVYTGGLSSYCLVVLLFSFMRECEQYGYSTKDCGHLLIGFFNHFLWRFESNLTHVDDPLAPSYYQEDGTHVLGENIMHSCYQIGRVCHCFKRALHLLTPEYNDWENSETQLLAQMFGTTRYTQTDEDEIGQLRPTSTEPHGGADPSSRAADAGSSAAILEACAAQLPPDSSAASSADGSADSSAEAAPPADSSEAASPAPEADVPSLAALAAAAATTATGEPKAEGPPAEPEAATPQRDSGGAVPPQLAAPGAEGSAESGAPSAAPTADAPLPASPPRVPATPLAALPAASGVDPTAEEGSHRDAKAPASGQADAVMPPGTASIGTQVRRKPPTPTPPPPPSTSGATSARTSASMPLSLAQPPRQLSRGLP